MLYGSDLLSLAQTYIGIEQKTEKTIMRVICRVKLVDRKSEDLMLMLGLEEAIYQPSKVMAIDKERIIRTTC